MENSQSSQQLCQRAQNGDRDDAAQLVALHYRQVFAYLCRLTGNPSEAEDLTQRAFSKAWKALPSFSGKSSFSTWIHGISHHVYVDWMREPRRSDRRTDAWWELVEAEVKSPFESAAEADLAHRLYQLVEGLNEDARQVIHLHYYQGLSLQDTAEALGIATSTVKYRLRGALDSIRAQMNERNSTAVMKGVLR